MRVAALICLLASSIVQTTPIVLSHADIGDNYYDEPPTDLRAVRSWVGLYVDKAGGSRLAPARVRFVKKKDDPAGASTLQTAPANAVVLVSGIRNIVPGPAITAAQSLSFWQEKSEAQISLRNRLYTIRLISREPNYCDAVLSLTSGATTQTLFDIKNLPTDFSCDEPHFEIHWAGDLDRDGKLDLVATLSQKYSYHPRQLFLSSAARQGDLVAEVARYERFAM